MERKEKMKDYKKPEVEVVKFETEVIADVTGPGAEVNPESNTYGDM